MYFFARKLRRKLKSFGDVCASFEDTRVNEKVQRIAVPLQLISYWRENITQHSVPSCFFEYLPSHLPLFPGVGFCLGTSLPSPTSSVLSIFTFCFVSFSSRILNSFFRPLQKRPRYLYHADQDAPTPSQSERCSGVPWIGPRSSLAQTEFSPGLYLPFVRVQKRCRSFRKEKK